MTTTLIVFFICAGTSFFRAPQHLLTAWPREVRCCTSGTVFDETRAFRADRSAPNTPAAAAHRHHTGGFHRRKLQARRRCSPDQNDGHNDLVAWF